MFDGPELSLLKLTRILFNLNPELVQNLIPFPELPVELAVVLAIVEDLVQFRQLEDLLHGVMIEVLPFICLRAVFIEFLCLRLKTIAFSQKCYCYIDFTYFKVERRQLLRELIVVFVRVALIRVPAPLLVVLVYLSMGIGALDDDWAAIACCLLAQAASLLNEHLVCEGVLRDQLRPFKVRSADRTFGAFGQVLVDLNQLALLLECDGVRLFKHLIKGYSLCILPISLTRLEVLVRFVHPGH